MDITRVAHGCIVKICFISKQLFLYDDLQDVCKLLTEKHLKKAPVMKGNTMVGLINRSNITSYALNWFDKDMQQ